jgi:hypothetical protein
MYNAYITRIKNLHKHPNADKLQIGECFGNNVVVSLEYEDQQLGIYFPSDGQLSVEFAEYNNLLRKKDEEGNNIGGYMDPDKRNVTAIKLRGEKSDGLFLPLTSLDKFGDISTLKEGDLIGVWNGHEICTKYIPKRQHRQGSVSNGNKTRKKKVAVAPLFSEHADTEQLAYNLGAFKPGDEIEISLKMHGTSQRTGYLPVFKGYKRSLWDRITRKDGKPIYDWGYVSGTRRVVLDDYEGGYYGSNSFREQHSKFFEGKLWKGETVYYEVVGFTDTGAPIMGDCDNKKLNDKEFVKQYGKTTTFSYGCLPEAQKKSAATDAKGNVLVEFGRDIPQSDFYVYRMTMTNEDGQVVEYTPDFMRYRCEQMGAKTVPVFVQTIIPEFYQLPDNVGSLQAIDAGEYVREMAEKFYDGPDPIGITHVREGVVVRIVNRPKFAAYKHKNWSFKCLEGIVKAEAEAPDMEEEQNELSQ